jgi:4-amino-4-deoxy-L-arabinose transferase-like glycosyltransferase
MILGFILAGFPAWLLLLAAVYFLCGGVIQAWLVYAGGFAALASGFAAARHYFREKALKYFVAASIAAVVIFGVFFNIAGSFYDMSYDGAVYHQEAVIKLVENWNPVYEHLYKLQTDSPDLLNHYAKGPWIYEAALYKATPAIENAKVFNFLLLSAALCFTLAALKSYPKIKQPVLFSVLLTCNPVMLYQTLSFYIDGQLGSLLLCFLALAFMITQQRDNCLYAALIMVIVLLANVKFTGVVYVCCGGVLLICWLWGLGQRNRIAAVIKTGLVGILLAICLAGFNPYVTNTLNYGHPFFPLYGAGQNSMDIMTSNSPKGFLALNRFEKLLLASFSCSDNALGIDLPRLKPPFVYEKREIEFFLSATDTRIGGFGPLYGGMLLLSVLLFAALWWYKRQSGLYAALAAGTIFLSAIINPEAWWARYAPQLWAIPIIAAMGALAARNIYIKIGGWLIAGLLIFNIALVALPYTVGNYYSSAAWREMLDELKASNEPLTIYFGEFRSKRAQLAEQGIKYIEIRYNHALPEGGIEMAPVDRSVPLMRNACIDAVRSKPIFKWFLASGKPQG